MRILKLSDKFYCIADNGFAYEEFENRISDVLHLQKDSFAEIYSKRIFRDCFQYARDLKKEYLSYYHQEYEDFDDYLYTKELLNREQIESLDLSEGQTLLKLNLYLSSYNTQSMLEYGEQQMDILNQALEGIRF